jgi:RimJ/RimL family protein N-acetyltransferase
VSLEEPAGERVETVDGVPFIVRPIQPDDKAALLEAFQRLSQESVYKRFLSPLKRLTESELAYLTELDHRSHEALVAVADTGEMIGVTRCVRQKEDPTRAEVAVTVVDDWQQRGVGTALLGLLARRAREEGVQSFTGVCLARNQEMLQLFDELGPTVKRRPGGSDVIEVEVTLPSSATESIRPALRAAARSHPAGAA